MNYIKKISYNGNNFTSVDNCNQMVSWISSIVSSIDQTESEVVIDKTDGTQIIIPLSPGVSTDELYDILNNYVTKLDFQNQVTEIYVRLDDYVTLDQMKRLIKYNTGCSTLCVEKFVAEWVDNRDCCGGITLINSKLEEINILEDLHVEDITDNGNGTFTVTKCDDEFTINTNGVKEITKNAGCGYTVTNKDGSSYEILTEKKVNDINETSTGTFTVTKCDGELDIVVGDEVVDNGNGTYTVNPGDGRPSFVIDTNDNDTVVVNPDGSFTFNIGGNEVTIDNTHTTAVDNGDNTYTFCNHDGSPCFTIEISDNITIPAVTKYILLDKTLSSAWYPSIDNTISLIPVPGYDILDFGNIDVIWVDITNPGSITNNAQHNQFNHNGLLINETLDACVDNVGSFGSPTVTPYSYALNNYTLVGDSVESVIQQDIGIGYIVVYGAIPMVDLTRLKKNIMKYSDKQKELIDINSKTFPTKIYNVWRDVYKHPYTHHKRCSQLLTRYLNEEDTTHIISSMENQLLEWGINE